MESVDLVIRNGLVVTQNQDHEILYDTDVAVQDGRIVQIGWSLLVQGQAEIDAQDRLVMPGLINAHMHETLTRGVCEDLPLDRWLNDICFPLDRAYTPEIMRAAAMMCQLEMIRGGTTTFVDIYRHPAACAEVALRSGLRAMFVPQIILEPLGAGETIESAEAFVTEWKGRSPLIVAGFGPHAPYSVPPEGFRRVATLAEAYDVPLHTHLSETQWETETIRARYGCTPAEMLLEAGALNPRLSAAHGVYLSDRDAALLAERGISIVHNPSSNMKLASGVAPVGDYLAAGINVALGTDSNLSNNNLDMFEEMRLAALLQKLSLRDATALPVQTVLDMATRNGARLLGLQDQIGSLEVGKQADMILIDLKQPHLWPLIQGRYENVEEQIVYAASGSDVTHTIVSGEVLMAERNVLTLDLEEADCAVREATAQLLRRAGLQ